MSRDRKRLGRGLDAIFGTDKESSEAIRHVPIDKIRPNPHQPRRSFSEDTLSELSASIKIHGIIQPLIVVEDVDGYTLVAGERRWRAAQLANLTSVPVVVRQLDPMGMTELALIENLQREDLSPIEEAHAYQLLQEEYSLTQEAIAERVGKSRSQIANTLRLLSLDPEVQRDVHEGKISMGHAKLLLSIPDSNEQKRLARLTISNGWTVRELGEQINSHKKSARVKPTSRSKKSTAGNDDLIDPHWLAAAEDIQRVLGTRVEIHPGKNDRQGKIVLHFYGVEDFERIYRLITMAEA